MAVDWKAQLIASIKDESAEKNRAAARAEALEQAWVDLETAISGAITEVSQGIGIAIEPWGRREDGRVRWLFSGRQLAVYVDRATARCVVTVDLGRGLEMMPFAPNESGPGLVDEQGLPAPLDAICERAVSLLFRGQA